MYNQPDTMLLTIHATPRGVHASCLPLLLTSASRALKQCVVVPEPRSAPVCRLRGAIFVVALIRGGRTNAGAAGLAAAMRRASLKGLWGGNPDMLPPSSSLHDLCPSAGCVQASCGDPMQPCCEGLGSRGYVCNAGARCVEAAGARTCRKCGAPNELCCWEDNNNTDQQACPIGEFEVQVGPGTKRIS